MGRITEMQYQYALERIEDLLFSVLFQSADQNRPYSCVRG